MVCCVVDCPNKTTTSSKCRSFSFPSTYYTSIKLRELSKKRRDAWVKALRITKPNTKVLNRQTVCYRHFVKGFPAKLTQETDPDWVPSQLLGNGENTICVQEVRKLKRKEKVKVQPVNLYADESLEISDSESFDGNCNDYDEPNMEYVPVTSMPEVRSLNTARNQAQQAKVHTMILNPSKAGTPPSPIKGGSFVGGINRVTYLHNRNSIQNEVSLEKLKLELLNKEDIIYRLRLKEKEDEEKYKNTCNNYELQVRTFTLDINRLKIKLRLHDISFEGLKTDDVKVKNLTGLPNFAVLQRLFDVVKEDLNSQTKTKLTKFDSFVVTLMKLRLDLPISYLSYVFGESAVLLSRLYRENLLTMNVKIGPLVKWPDDEALLASTPNCFKEIMGEKCIILIHFLEIIIKNLSSAKTEVTLLKHKIKYLIAFTPAGEIIFVSQGFGSSVSDEDIIQNSGFFDKITENHIFLSVKEMFDDKQKDDEQIQQIKQFAKNSEDKVLDILRDNFRILFNPQAVNLNGEAYSEYTVRCCCALSNLQMPELIVIDTKQVAETVVVHTKTPQVAQKGSSIEVREINPPPVEEVIDLDID
ncbi:uncharacterized protein LOC129907575 [Episyrphus balteatus]|uniref:uncharacterized protein LOC129907575 n=1 Tax=Episyrphus balteatus TaxID=286459 RepID=UPI0024863401|nr:uncharacterized protein LOC129907575 [Episyrphus balteatus]